MRRMCCFGITCAAIFAVGAILSWHRDPADPLPTDLSVARVTGQATPAQATRRLEKVGAVLSYEGASVVGITFGWPYVDNEHFADLLTYTKLKRIDFNASPNVNDDTLRILARLPSIEELNLGGTRITDKSLPLLQGLPRLRKLYLWRTKLSDEGMKSLASLPSLQYLNLWDSPIGDAGLLHLAKSKTLRQLGIGQSIQAGDEQQPALQVNTTTLTPAAIERFRKQCPQCRIFYWQRSGKEASPDVAMLARRAAKKRSPGAIRPPRAVRWPATIAERKKGHDWASFLGPTNDGKSSETGLQIANDDGYQIVWQRPLGEGYGTCTVSRGRLFILERVAEKMRLLCLKAETGDVLWQHESTTAYEDQLGYGNGPRCSPVVDGDRVYAYAADGHLFCVSVETGKVIWHVDTFKRFGVVQYFFGVGSTPLVHGDLLIAVVGGSPANQGRQGNFNLEGLKGNGTGIVAFNKYNGEVQYAITDTLASYASPRLTKINGRDWCWAFVREGLVGFDPTTGHVHSIFPWRAKFRAGVNAATPVVRGDEVFITEAYGPGSALLRVTSNQTQVLWQDQRKSRQKSLPSHWSTPILHKGFLYGCAGRHTADAEFRCVEWKTGQVVWRQKLDGLSSLLYVDEHFVVVDEYARLSVIRATPLGYLPRHTSDLSQPYRDGRPLLSYPIWSAPVLARGLLYLRGKNRLVCMEIIPQ